MYQDIGIYLLQKLKKEIKMISALVSSYWVDDEKPEILKKCLNSLEGADEILSLVTHKKTPLGFSDAWNRLATLAKGDYLIFIGDNNTLVKGTLDQLCIPGTVTSPLINGQSQEFWGMVFCLPREVYEELGLYDMRFNNGSHWEDTDLWRRIKKAEIPLQSVKEVDFYRPSGGRSIDADPRNVDKKSINCELFKDKWKE